MTEHTVTTTFEHLSDADAARAVLESSIRGVQVVLEPMGAPANDDRSSMATDPDGMGWVLSADVPAGMEETAATLLHATAEVDISSGR